MPVRQAVSAGGEGILGRCSPLRLKPPGTDERSTTEIVNDRNATETVAKESFGLTELRSQVYNDARMKSNERILPS